MRPVRITLPAQVPVSLAEAKAHLRVETDDEDALITGLIAAAVDHLDGWQGVLGRCIISQEWEVSATRFCGTGYRFPMPDVTDVTVVYDDANGDEQTVAPTEYGLGADALGSYLRWRSGWTAPSLHAEANVDPVRYRFTCGLADDAASVPAALGVAISMHVAALYDNRSAASVDAGQVVPFGYDALVGPYCVARI